MLLDGYMQALAESPLHLAFILVWTVLGMGMYIWCCVDDVRTRSVVTWKLALGPFLISLGAVLSSVLPEPLGCGCPWLWPWMLGALVVWIALMVLNMAKNQERVIGQADVTIGAWMLCVTVAFIGWVLQVDADNPYVALQIMNLVLTLMISLLLGALLLVAGYLIYVVIKKVTQHITMTEALKEYGRAPMLVALIPTMWMISYMVLTT